MKHVLLFAGLFCCYGFVKYTELKKDVKREPFPEGFSYISEKYIAGHGEVTNADYQIFLNEIRNDSSLYTKVKIKPERWHNTIKSDFDTLEQFYHRDPYFKDFPVVNISYKGAVEYCKWLTKKMHNEGILYEFRLPTEKEWELIAKNTDDSLSPYPTGRSLQNYHGHYLANFAILRQENFYTDSLTVPLGYNLYTESLGPCRAIPATNYLKKLKKDMKAGNVSEEYYFLRQNFYFPPNDFVLYHICGNVAEMVAEEGVSKGGSWGSLGGDLSIFLQEKYEGPNPYTGFRVIGVKKEKAE